MVVMAGVYRRRSAGARQNEECRRSLVPLPSGEREGAVARRRKGEGQRKIPAHHVRLPLTLPTCTASLLRRAPSLSPWGEGNDEHRQQILPAIFSFITEPSSSG